VTEIEATVEEPVWDDTANEPAEAHGPADLQASRAWALAGAVAWDIVVVLIVVALVVATILFASHVSSFIYVDF
jgi:hypothetical protein